MIEAGELKPLLSTLVLPPAGPLLLAAAGLWLISRRKTAGAVLAAGALLLTWLLSCHAVAIVLAQTLLPQYAPLNAATLKGGSVKAIVVLGGGVLPQAPEYGQAQLNGTSAARLRYGLWLARASGLPAGFAGGVGWAAAGMATDTEGAAARRAAQEAGAPLRWVDEASRDTAENGRLMAALLQRDGVRHVALVTDAWHMPRSVQAFERAGLQVTPAPTGFALPLERPLLEWLPSTHGLRLSRTVLREWLGLLVARFAG